MITPTAYDSDGMISAANAVFTVYTYNESGEKTVSRQENPAVTIEKDGQRNELKIPLVQIPISYVDEGGHVQPSTVGYDQKLTVTQNSNGTTKVSYDFGPLYNTNNATSL